MTYDEVNAITRELVRELDPPAQIAINPYMESIEIYPREGDRGAMLVSWGNLGDRAIVAEAWKEHNA